MEYASTITRLGLKFQVFSDNKASLLRLYTPSDLLGQVHQIRTSLATEVIVSKGGSISLNWVPGHVEVYRNELVDKLAKEATKLEPNTNETSFGVLSQKAKEASTKE